MRGAAGSASQADDRADGAVATAHASAGGETALPAVGSPRASSSETVSLRGRVEWIGKALETRFGIALDLEAAERVLAMVTDDGQILPLVEDARGRAFRRDQRLRDRDLELLARQLPGTGLIQVIRIYFVKPDGKFVVDYWCDVCAIVMYEDGPCQCCQQPNRLRERAVE